MPSLIAAPVRIEPPGNKPKIIDEYVGRVSTGDEGVSVAHMRSPSGWEETPQAPAFDEFTIVLAGMLRVTGDDGDLDVNAGQAVLVRADEKVRYSTPGPEGAEYVSVCVPAFSLELARRVDG